MAAVFYISSAVAVVATLLTITSRNAIHALLYLIVSLLAVAIDFFVMGAPFVAALELIIYAGAIMVLFIFVVMMLNMGEHAGETALDVFKPRAWAGPSLLALVLLAEIAALVSRQSAPLSGVEISSKQVGVALFGPYVIGVELASLLLTAGLLGAYHLGRKAVTREDEVHGIDTRQSRAVTGDPVVPAGAGRSSHAA